jgi:hypothetical protein
MAKSIGSIIHLAMTYCSAKAWENILMPKLTLGLGAKLIFYKTAKVSNFQ